MKQQECNWYRAYWRGLVIRLQDLNSKRLYRSYRVILYNNIIGYSASDIKSVVKEACMGKYIVYISYN